MNFVSIDFETATAPRDSPCEIGLTFVKDFKIVETKSWLIKPYYPEFNYFNKQVHGITEEDVKNKPYFNELWSEIRPLIENQLLIAHNAAFDLSVLRSTLDRYKIEYPTLSYACSYILSRKAWEGLISYNLKGLAKAHGINSFRHHRAAADSLVCAEITLRAFKHAGISSIEDIPEKLRTTVGSLSPGNFKPCKSKAGAPKKKAPVKLRLAL